MTTRRPKLIVLDLDWTLWPFHVEMDVDPPFKKQSGKVVDRHGSEIKHFPEVPVLLEKLTSDGYEIAAASRTHEVEGAKQLLKLFGWDKYFSYKEIYPGCKKTHFNMLKEKSGYNYSEMLFFDDDYYLNIKDSVSIGVTSVLANCIEKDNIKIKAEK
ncbi:Hypothetical predicted protein [Cloeon dipterum]|uniref:Magnesium-dependent phosphatase-1 n=1 Tax=Cloeon dipterum TaxID=197152 RepID=A0A8S1CC98_9INSE|nr:Hypothetical predicted protein [Cloeon dipterum]